MQSGVHACYQTRLTSRLVRNTKASADWPAAVGDTRFVPLDLRLLPVPVAVTCAATEPNVGVGTAAFTLSDIAVATSERFAKPTDGGL